MQKNNYDFFSDFKTELKQNFQIEAEISTFLEPIFINEKLQIYLISTLTEIVQISDIQKIILELRKSKYPKLIVIFESVWIEKKVIILHKIAVMLGHFTLLHGRKCNIKEVSIEESQQFLNDFHLLGYTKTDIRLGLYFNNQLVALSVWGKVRYMKYETPPYYSAELIKFTSLPKTSIAGGLSKLISHFQMLHHCKTIMTYADIAWYVGNTFENLGFIPCMLIDNKSNNSLGSIKYIKTY